MGLKVHCRKLDKGSGVVREKEVTNRFGDVGG